MTEKNIQAGSLYRQERREVMNIKRSRSLGKISNQGGECEGVRRKEKRRRETVDGVAI